jgi:hypothetical protein
LSKHDVACDQVPRWDKTPAHDRPAGVVDLVDVRSCAVTDAIAPPAVTANNVETFRCAEMRFLLGGQPFSQQRFTASLLNVLDRFEPLAQGLNLARALSQRTPKIARRGSQPMRVHDDDI